MVNRIHVGAVERAAPSPVEHSRWSWQIGRLFGVSIRMHATFVALLAWILFGHLLAGHAATVALFDLLLVSAIFAIVVLHELGHALTARAYGIRTRSIMLLPIGGIASLERMPEKPSQELLVALAGPAVNVVLAGLVFAWLLVSGGPLGPDVLTAPTGHLATKLLYINLSLAAFNLLPAFPMDGGRALRAGLSYWVGRLRATELAAQIGKGMAVLFGIFGFFANPMLVIIAVFVWIGAGAEAGLVRVKSLLASVPVRAATVVDLHAVGPDDTLESVARHALDRAQHDFPVVHDDVLVGVLTRGDLLRGLTEVGSNGAVGGSMHTAFSVAEADEPLAGVLERLERGGTPIVVTDGPSVLGLLTTENLGDLLLVEGALFERRSHARSTPGGAVPPHVWLGS